MAERKENIAARQARFGATAGLYTIVVLGVLVILNWLGKTYNKTYDTTSNKRFTLSQETTKVVDGLKQDATIVYFDKASGFDSAKGILDRYKNLSAKVHVQYVDFQKEPTLAKSYGLRFPGTAYVEIAQRREEAKSLNEEGITGAFLKDLKGVRKVCVVKGGQEHPLDDADSNGLSKFKTLLERDNYVAESITLLDKTAVPPDCNVVVIAGPQADYTANEVAALKTFIENGGRGFFLLDPPLDFGREHIAENAGLTELLSGWGITGEKDLVLEQNPMGQMFGFGPEIPLVSSYESHPIVNELKNSYTGFPVARSLDVKNAGKATNTKLFSTSDKAIATTRLNSNAVDPSDPSNKKGPFVLGAAGEFNTGKPSNPGRYVVVGSSGFLSNSMFGFQANRDLALSSVNWLSSDEDLISIRPKEPEDRKLDANQRQMNVFAYTDLLAIPLMIIVGGVAVFLKRR
jgi:ABC-type uncharacterized transport system involved in gliding motility auxiliary subunit